MPNVTELVYKVVDGVNGLAVTGTDAQITGPEALSLLEAGPVLLSVKQEGYDLTPHKHLDAKFTKDSRGTFDLQINYRDYNASNSEDPLRYEDHD